MFGPQYPYPMTPTRRTSRARPGRGRKTVEVLTLKVVAIRLSNPQIECASQLQNRVHAPGTPHEERNQGIRCQYAPSPENTARGVCSRIFRSDNGEQVFEYCRSRRTISSKVVLLRPRTCHRPVIPGLASNKRRRCHTS